MADDPTIEEVAAAKAQLLRDLDEGCACSEDAVRTLLASHASLEERVKEALALLEKWGLPFAALRGSEAEHDALAAFVNEKET